MWSAFVDLIRMTIFTAAHVCGGSLGAGIVAVSVVMRLALMPLSYDAKRPRLSYGRPERGASPLQPHGSAR